MLHLNKECYQRNDCYHHHKYETHIPAGQKASALSLTSRAPATSSLETPQPTIKQWPSAALELMQPCPAPSIAYLLNGIRHSPMGSASAEGRTRRLGLLCCSPPGSRQCAATRSLRKRARDPELQRAGTIEEPRRNRRNARIPEGNITRIGSRANKM